MRGNEMEVEEGSCAVYSHIQRLPVECVSHAISLTYPRDACRSEAVSAMFRSAAVSDDVWKRFLPYDYDDILARAVDQVEFASLKQLYFRLCDPILIDGGKMGFYVDRDSGAKCFILSARELGIIWGDTPQYWRWSHHPESRFSEVAELLNVCWLEVHGKINSRILSKRTNYSAYLIFKTSNARGLSHPLQEALVTLGGCVSQHSVCLTKSDDHSRLSPPLQLTFRRPRFFLNFLRRANLPHEPREDLPELPNDQPAEPVEDDVEDPDHDQRRRAADEPQGERRVVGKPKVREDGWMEILLGEFFNEEGEDGEVDMSLLEIKGGNWKSGLIVQGIEIRPKK